MQININGRHKTKCTPVRKRECLDPSTYMRSSEVIYAIDSAIENAENILKEDENVEDITTEMQMSLDEYRFLITEAAKNGQKKGRVEAWDLARRVVVSTEDCYSFPEIAKIFGCNTLSGVFNILPDEAIEKDREAKKPHVGDEVECKGIKGYIVKILPDTYIQVLTKDGTYTLLLKNCKKTGKTNEDLVKALAAFEDMEDEK